MKTNQLRGFGLGLLGLFLMTSPSSRLMADDNPTTFKVTAGAFPWIDRLNVWQLAEVPPSLEGNGPLPLQNCGSRSIVTPDNTKYLILAVSTKDVDKFKTDFPTAQPTGDSISVVHADGTGSIPYTIFKLDNPPSSVGDPGFAAGLILLQVNDKPGSSPTPGTTPSTNAAPTAPATK